MTPPTIHTRTSYGTAISFQFILQHDRNHTILLLLLTLIHIPLLLPLLPHSRNAPNWKSNPYPSSRTWISWTMTFFNGPWLSWDLKIHPTPAENSSSAWPFPHNTPSNRPRSNSTPKSIIPPSCWKRAKFAGPSWGRGDPRSMPNIVYRPSIPSCNRPNPIIPFRKILPNNWRRNPRNLKKWPRSIPRIMPSKKLKNSSNSRNIWKGKGIDSLLRRWNKEGKWKVRVLSPSSNDTTADRDSHSY